MLQAKKDALNKSGQLQELMDNALAAFRSYSGNRRRKRGVKWKMNFITSASKA